MGKKKTIKEKSIRYAKGGRSPSKLNVDVKIGILHTIADAIYATAAGKIREAVANARDNDATWILIIIDQTTKSLFICDNGCGITTERFHEIFKSIGYGLLRNTSDKKLSYFGIGLMSIFQLGNKVKVFTKPHGEKQVYRLEVDTQSIFDANNEKRSISELSKYIKLQKSSETERTAASVSLLNRCLSDSPFKGNLNSFTEIIIEDVKDEDFDIISDPQFVDELRKILPLKPEKDEPFLGRLTGKKGKKVQEIISDKEFCKTIDTYFGFQEEGNIERLWKYFPAFRSDLAFPDDNVLVGKSTDEEFAYYVLHSVAVDLHRSSDIERETGFWVRNQNFLVKSADFLERPGPGRKTKTIDQPLKAWVFGEIFHKDMNPFLAVSRNEYLFEKNSFKKFHQEIKDIVSPLNNKLRRIHEKRKTIIDGLVGPFSQLTAPDGTIQKTDKRLKAILHEDVSDTKFRQKMFDRLKKARNKEIEKEGSRVDILLRQTKIPITLGEDENALVCIDPALRDNVQDCDVKWDAGNNRVIASISPNLFDPKEVVFLDKTFTLYFVAEKEKAPGVSIDPERDIIYINPFNEELTKYSVSIFDVYVTLQIANAISQNKNELVKNALTLLGARSDITSKYITPLGDDLRRTLKLTHVGT